MPGFQSTRLVTEGALEPFFFLYTDDSIQGNTETCKQSSIMLNYEVKNNKNKMVSRYQQKVIHIRIYYSEYYGATEPPVRTGGSKSLGIIIYHMRIMPFRRRKQDEYL